MTQLQEKVKESSISGMDFISCQHYGNARDYLIVFVYFVTLESYT